MNNDWNKVIYNIWSPVYDKVFNSGRFLQVREQMFKEINFHKGASILFVGVGTGVDIEQLNHSEYCISAIDFSPDMLERARGKFQNSTITFIEMDAEQMNFQGEKFDYVVANLILSVVPSADKCIQEMIRVTKTEGQIVIFDKFVPKGKKLSLPKKLIRPLVSILGTDIGLKFEEMIENYKNLITVTEDKPVMFNGMYRRLVLKKV